MTQRHWLAILAALCLLAAPLPAWSANDLQHFLNLGAQALKAGNALLAIQNFQQAVQKSPNNHQAWYKLAEAQFKNKSYEDAVRSATKAIYLASDKPELLAKYYAGRAWACYKAGMNGQAVVDMERATELAPDNRQYQNWLAGARQQEQRQGPGKELASVLGQEETPRDSHSRGEESQAGQTYREDEQGRSADGETRDSQASDKYESQRGRESQGGASSYREEESDRREQTRGLYQEDTGSGRQQEETSRDQYQEQPSSRDQVAESDSGDVISGLSANCRKSYFVCMAGCADIQDADNRAICERACASAAKACR